MRLCEWLSIHYTRGGGRFINVAHPDKHEHIVETLPTSSSTGRRRGAAVFVPVAADARREAGAGRGGGLGGGYVHVGQRRALLPRAVRRRLPSAALPCRVGRIPLHLPRRRPDIQYVMWLWCCGPW